VKLYFKLSYGWSFKETEFVTQFYGIAKANRIGPATVLHKDINVWLDVYMKCVFWEILDKLTYRLNDHIVNQNCPDINEKSSYLWARYINLKNKNQPIIDRLNSRFGNVIDKVMLNDDIGVICDEIIAQWEADYIVYKQKHYTNQ
jgi:hypothetical protein